MRSDPNTPRERNIRSEVFWSDVVLTGVGFSTAVLTALVLALIGLRFRVALYAFTWRGILPYGGVICGLVAVSGFDLAARVIGRRPGPLGRASILTSPLIAYILIFTFEYQLLDINGTPVASALSFPVFVDTVVRSTSLLFVGSRVSTDTAGIFGYWLFVISGVGFAAAGVLMLVRLSQLSCRQCARYLPPLTTASGYGTPAQLVPAYSRAEQLASQGFVDSARDLVDGLPQSESSHKLTVEAAECSECHISFFRLRLLAFRTYAGHVTLGRTSPSPSWVPIKGYEVAGQVSVRHVAPRH